MAFIRMYGMEGDPGPRPAPKRKSAAAGPRAKASRKRVVRTRRAARGGQGAPKGPGKKNRGIDMGAVGRGALDLGLQFVPGGKFAKAGAQAALGMLGGAMGGRAAGGGGGRRSMNVANVKALRKALRRFEGFKKLVKRVDKMLPTGAKLHTSRPSHSGGHKRGCKCATCR